MSTQGSALFCILAAIDYSDTASLVVQEAVELSRQKHAGQLHFLHVNAAPLNDAGQHARHAELLEWLGTRLHGHPGVGRDVRVVAHELSGDPAKLILETASDLSADLVLVGTHGRKGIQRLLLGSVAAAVVQNSGSSVFVVRPKHYEQVALQIEPACPRCVEARTQSQGSVWWCEQHTERHGRRHTYYDPHASSWVSQRLMP